MLKYWWTNLDVHRRSKFIKHRGTMNGRLCKFFPCAGRERWHEVQKKEPLGWFHVFIPTTLTMSAPLPLWTWSIINLWTDSKFYRWSLNGVWINLIIFANIKLISKLNLIIKFICLYSSYIHKLNELKFVNLHIRWLIRCQKDTSIVRQFIKKINK
jgi:hypothetical protein